MKNHFSTSLNGFLNLISYRNNTHFTPFFAKIHSFSFLSFLNFDLLLVLLRVLFCYMMLFSFLFMSIMFFCNGWLMRVLCQVLFHGLSFFLRVGSMHFPMRLVTVLNCVFMRNFSKRFCLLIVLHFFDWLFMRAMLTKILMFVMFFVVVSNLSKLIYSTDLRLIFNKIFFTICTMKKAIVFIGKRFTLLKLSLESPLFR